MQSPLRFLASSGSPLCSVIVQRTVCTSASVSFAGKNARLALGKSRSSTEFGPLVDKPDWSYADGTPAPLTPGQNYRRNLQLRHYDTLKRVFKQMYFTKLAPDVPIPSSKESELLVKKAVNPYDVAEPKHTIKESKLKQLTQVALRKRQELVIKSAASKDSPSKKAEAAVAAGSGDVPKNLYE